MIARPEKSVHRLKCGSIYHSIRKRQVQVRKASRVARYAALGKATKLFAEVRRGGACTPVRGRLVAVTAASLFPATRTAPPAGGFGSVRQALLRVPLAGLANSPVPQRSFPTISAAVAAPTSNPQVRRCGSERARSQMRRLSLPWRGSTTNEVAAPRICRRSRFPWH